MHNTHTNHKDESCHHETFQHHQPSLKPHNPITMPNVNCDKRAQMINQYSSLQQLEFIAKEYSKLAGKLEARLDTMHRNDHGPAIQRLGMDKHPDKEEVEKLFSKALHKDLRTTLRNRDRLR